jgi:hypothetical protein
VKVLRAGQCLKHEQYGIGIVDQSNEDRTTIEFYEHGPKKFVTRLLQAELVAEAPPKPGKSRSGSSRSKKSASAK